MLGKIVLRSGLRLARQAALFNSCIQTSPALSNYRPSKVSYIQFCSSMIYRFLLNDNSELFDTPHEYKGERFLFSPRNRVRVVAKLSITEQRSSRTSCVRALDARTGYAVRNQASRCLGSHSCNAVIRQSARSSFPDRSTAASSYFKPRRS